jgi:hypothetical protein
MSLRIRLMISTAVVLFLCLAIDSVFVYWHTVGKVDTEIRAALAVGAHSVRNAVADGRAEGLSRGLAGIAGDGFQRGPPFARVVG